MTLPNIPPSPTSGDWKQWASSLRDYLMKERAQSSKASPAAPQIAHKKSGESAAQDGVLIYNPTDEEMEVSVGGVFKRMLRNELEFLEFSTTETTPVTQAQMSWDDAEGTVSLGLNDEVALQLGQEVLYRVKNSTGSTIPNGTVVSAAGTEGASGHILAQPFIADGTIPPRYILGICTQEILNGEFGFVTHFGKVRDIDTSIYSEGAVLYASASTAGALTSTAPTSPDYEMPIAYALNSKNNGTLFVRIQTGYELHEIYDVEITSPADGQFIRYISGSQRWENATVNLDDISDVSITSPANNHVLRFNGSNWVNTLAELEFLSDVDITSPANNHVLKFNGTNWVNDLADLDFLSDVDITSPSSDHVLRYNGSQWVNVLGNLTNISDVTVTGPSAGETLRYNGSQWVNQFLGINDISYFNVTGQAAGDVLQYNGSLWVAGGDEFPRIVSAPATATSSGSVGQIAVDTGYLYVCVATDTWKRTALSTW